MDKPYKILSEIIAEINAYAAIGTVEEFAELLRIKNGGVYEERTLFGVPLEHIKELLSAEEEGRLLVLPCKCGECEKYKSVSPKCGNCNRTTVIQHPEDYCNHGIRREK